MMFSFCMVLPFIRVIAAQEIILCKDPKVNSECVLMCETPNLKGNVYFKRDISTFGSCNLIFGRHVCNSVNGRFVTSIDVSKHVTFLTIKMLDKNEDEGFWHCEYDNKLSNKEQLQIYDKDSRQEYQPHLSVKEHSTIIDYKTFCLMPKPKASFHYKNSTEECTVSVVEEKCVKPSLRNYNVRCTTSESYLPGTQGTVLVQVYDDITVDNKNITFEQIATLIPEVNSSPSNDLTPKAIVIPCVIGSAFIIAVVVLIAVHNRDSNSSSKNTRKENAKDGKNKTPLLNGQTGYTENVYTDNQNEEEEEHHQNC